MYIIFYIQYWCENNLLLNLILIESVFAFVNYKQNITKGVSGNITNKPIYIYIYLAWKEKNNDSDQ